MQRYDRWTRTELTARLSALDTDPSPQPPGRPVRESKPLDLTRAPKRKIALKLCYHGWEFCGLEKQKGYTPLPTVESVLESALVATRLIDGAAGLEGAGYGKSGRTDRGVSAAGQVVSVWVRSLVRGKGGKRKTEEEEVSLVLDDEESEGKEAEAGPSGTPHAPASPGAGIEPAEAPPATEDDETQHLLPTTSEIPYARVLNRVLPPSIRVLAWSPIAHSFEARFSCTGRHYKYFFRLHPGLNLERMRDAAERMEGTHDWRNFCRLDGSKGEILYVRTIERVSIDPVAEDESGFPPDHASKPRLTDPSLYVLNVQGLGFLWHQIRHIAAILFLIGQGLEEPSLVSALLNTDSEHPLPPFREGEPAPQVVPSKPSYEMADALPLVLWDTKYRDEELDWQRDEPGFAHYFAQSLNRTYTASLLQTTVLSYLSRAAELRPPPLEKSSKGDLAKDRVTLDMGGGRMQVNERYRAVLTRERGRTPEELVRLWREGKGARRAEKRAGAEGEGEREVEEGGDGSE